MSEDPTRIPFSLLRASAPARDEAARERARALLEAHVAGTAPARPRLLRRWRPPSRWVASLAGVLVVAGAGAAVAAVLLRTDHTGHLPVFTPQGALSSQFHVGSHGSGYCWTASLATGASDAYRCMQGNAIHDPCFVDPVNHAMVACFIDPWHPVTMLRLDRPLPRHGPVLGSPLPWAIVTSDGRHCVFLTGATAPMGGERINYGCVGGSYLIGVPDRSHPLWTIRSARTYRPDAPGHPTPLRDFPLVGIRLTVP
jgi:hypothetical protein